MKEIKLKNGQILTIAPAEIEDAEEFTEYINTIRYESQYGDV